jgi:GT2 family glycosyltransferase
MNKISIIVVTFNRPLSLLDTIKSLINQSFDPFDIIVIDDGSEPPVNLDDIKSDNLELVRFDEEVGLSNARNFGIKKARGEYIAFIDDDAIADRKWLEEIQKGIDNGAEILGGPLKPIFESKPPKWWSIEDFGAYCAVGNDGQIWGANMAIKKEVFKKVGLFQPKLGRQKGKLLSGEETFFKEIARNKGYNLIFLPKAIMYHKVKAERMTLKYLLKWEYNKGKTLNFLHGYRPLDVFVTIIKELMDIFTPKLIFSQSKIKVKKLMKLAQLVAQIC